MSDYIWKKIPREPKKDLQMEIDAFLYMLKSSEFIESVPGKVLVRLLENVKDFLLLY